MSVSRHMELGWNVISELHFPARWTQALAQLFEVIVANAALWQRVL